MRIKLALVHLFLLVSVMVFGQKAANTLNKTLYYNTFASNDLNSVNNVLSMLKSSSEKDAFEGALLMKKAGLVSNPKTKLSLFKEGHAKLEAAISKDPSNVEYHFLRLMIQENAPGILNYNDNIVADSQLLKTSYKKLPEPALKALKDYSKASKQLKPEDFK